VFYDQTQVVFKQLSRQQIDDYVASGSPMDKAGAYGIQDTASLWISGIRGDYFNVVGLPVYRLETTLREQFGLSIW
jgi:septum formation protein